MVGPMGQSCSEVESQFSLQMFISSPFPTTHPRPCFNTSLPAKIPRQPCEALLGAEQVRRSSSLQYLLSSVCPSREVGSLRSLHVCLARRASLKTSISRKPRPPALYGSVRRSHAIQHIFLISGLTSHQNLVRTV